MISLSINGKSYSIETQEDMPLLWAVRDIIGLTGTKFGCGVAQCGACSILIDGTLTKSCSMPVSYGIGKQIFTIEGSSSNLEFLRKAWNDGNVPQCGYCQSGQIMQALALLQRIPDPDDAQIIQAMNGNLCRCGTYDRIRTSIKSAALVMRETR